MATCSLACCAINNSDNLSRVHILISVNPTLYCHINYLSCFILCIYYTTYWSKSQAKYCTNFRIQTQISLCKMSIDKCAEQCYNGIFVAQRPGARRSIKTTKNRGAGSSPDFLPLFFVLTAGNLAISLVALSGAPLPFR